MNDRRVPEADVDRGVLRHAVQRAVERRDAVLLRRLRPGLHVRLIDLYEVGARGVQVEDLFVDRGRVGQKWLTAQAAQPATIAELQALIDAFLDTYNTHRPHRSLPHRATPATAYAARPKATPGNREGDSHDRLRSDRVDNTGKVTLRHAGRLYSIGVGRTHTRTGVLMLVHDLDIRIIDAATGELLRQLVLDPTKRYQGIGHHERH